MTMLTWFVFDVVDGRFIAGSARLTDNLLTVRVPGKRTAAHVDRLDPQVLAKRLLRELQHPAQGYQ